MDDITVISSDIDGADLRRKRLANARHLRCAGRADDGEINEAIQSKGPIWSLGAGWEQVFGRRS